MHLFVLHAVTKPTSYSNSPNFSNHFAYHIAFLCYHVTVRLMAGSSNSHHTPVHMTRSSLMWLLASSHDSQSHSLFTFYLTCNTLLPSPLLLSSTFNLCSHSMTLSHLLLSLSSLPFATLLILQFTPLPSILTPQCSLLSGYLCHHSPLHLPPFLLQLSLSLRPFTLITLTTCITHLYD